VAIETAPVSHEITVATTDDMPFIRETIARLRLDGERLKAEQFIVLRRPDSGGIIGFGRVKPYRRTHELAGVAVVEEERGRGWGELIVRELVRRFPQDEVYVTTDVPEYFEGLGFLRTEALPPELAAKIERVRESLRPGAVGLVYDRRYERLPEQGRV